MLTLSGTSTPARSWLPATWLAAWLLALPFCGLPMQAVAEDAEPEATVSYYREVRPILQRHCQGCHQPATLRGGYDLTTHAAMLKPGDSEVPGVVAGKPAESELVTQIRADEGDRALMPPEGEGDPLTAEQVALIARWIQQGAADDTPDVARTVVDADHPPTYELAPVITAIAYSPDGQLIAVSGYHEVLLHQADGKKLVARLVGLSERIESLAFSPDGKWLAVVGGTPGLFGEVQLWDVAERKLAYSKTVTADTLRGVCFSPDGKLLAFGGTDNVVRALDVATGEERLYQGAHDDWVLDTTFDAAGNHVISVGRDRSAKLTEVATQRFIDNITSITPGALKGGLMAIAAHPSEDQILVGGADGTPKLYRIFREKARKIGDDFNLIRAFEPMPGRVYDLTFSADGSTFVAGSSLDGKGELRLYETATGKLLRSFEGGPQAIYSVDLSPDGTRLIAAGASGTVTIYDVATGKPIHEFQPVPLGAGLTQN